MKLRNDIYRAMARSALAALTVAMAAFVHANCQDQNQASIADLQKEAASWQQKIKDVENRITKTDVAIAGDVAAFRSYLRTEAAHKAQFEAQIDSLSQDIVMAKKRVDSLEQAAGNRKMSGAEADNQAEEMRLTLIAACGGLKEFYDGLPPSAVKATMATLDFLKGELESKTVTVSEAIERYWQILSALDDAEASMDTYAAESPVPGLVGQAYYVRIGLSYLAAVSEEGKTAFLWYPGGQDGEAGWKPLNDLAAKTALWDAVRIRGRKIVPRIVGLPFNHQVIITTVDETGKEKRGEGR